MHLNVLLSIFAVFTSQHTCSPVIGSVKFIWACIPSRLWNCPQSGLSNWNQTDKILGSIGTLSICCNCKILGSISSLSVCCNCRCWLAADWLL